MKALTTISTALNLQESEVIDKVTLWNTEGVYPQSLVSIILTDKGITHNAVAIKELAINVKEWALEQVQNTINDETLLVANRKAVKEINTYITNTRKMQTDGFRDTVSAFTENEKILKEAENIFATGIKEMKEELFKQNEITIKELLLSEMVKIEAGEHLVLEMFIDFVAKKREVKIWNTNKDHINTTIKKSVSDDITNVVRIAFEPIKVQLELNEKKASEQKLFDRYMENIPTEGNNNVLEASKISLVRFKETVETDYINIKDACLNSINNKMNTIDANMRGNNAVKVVEEHQNTDNNLLLEAQQLNNKQYTKMEDIDNAVVRCREIWKEVRGKEIRAQILVFGKSLSGRGITVKSEAVEQKEEVKLWSIDLAELESIAKETIKAETEVEAKKKFIEMFSFNIQYTNLKEM